MQLRSDRYVPEIRALYAGDAFHIEPVGVTYRVSGALTEARELINTGRA